GGWGWIIRSGGRGPASLVGFDDDHQAVGGVGDAEHLAADDAAGRPVEHTAGAALRRAGVIAVAPPVAAIAVAVDPPAADLFSRPARNGLDDGGRQVGCVVAFGRGE